MTTTTTSKTTKKVADRLINRMVGFYGTIEAARKAYVAARQTCRNQDKMRGGLVLWVSGSGRIVPSQSSEIFYSGSADAYDVLPS
jgi:hypothetical protein